MGEEIPDALGDTVDARWWQAVQPALSTIVSPTATIRPRTQTHDPQSTRTAAMLALARGNRDVAQRLHVEGTLGEGGMGVVRLARQTALDRSVAVKTLRPEHKTDQASLKLLREAWITGALEHPNILPVYDVGLDEDELPMIVLKCITGLDWIEVMHEPDLLHKHLGSGDPLELNLGVLMQVAQAVSFAHSRGILHRDIKPENVRLGSFGEVYLLDWGIAVALTDDGSGRFPLAADATEMAGTPSYMAPEMVGGDLYPLSERTDVYLLGAVLYECVTGRPPHSGTSPVAIIASVLKSEPPLPDDLPEPLRELIRDAMSPDPEQRIPSAEAFRERVQDFLRYRGALRLTADAEERTDELARIAQRAREQSGRYRATDRGLQALRRVPLRLRRGAVQLA